MPTAPWFWLIASLTTLVAAVFSFTPLLRPVIATMGWSWLLDVLDWIAFPLFMVMSVAIAHRVLQRQ